MSRETREWWEKQLFEIQKRLDYFFNDISLLEEALTHSSYSNEAGLPYSNERLEFLGDAVLEVTVSSYLYKKYPHMDEGELTRSRATIVRNDSLVNWSIHIGIAGTLLLGRGLSRQRMIDNKYSLDSINSDALEALFGAIFLDGGFSESSRIIQCYIDHTSGTFEDYSTSDPKSLLQAKTQKLGLGQPFYELETVTGPDHEPLFKVRVHIGEVPYMSGEGFSRKEAEFLAAEKSLAVLEKKEFKIY